VTRSKFRQLSVTGNWGPLFRHPIWHIKHDLPCNAIIADFLRSMSGLDGVKTNDDGNLSSAAMAESIDNQELELANANPFGTNSERELGRCKRKRTANTPSRSGDTTTLIRTTSNHSNSVSITICNCVI
jgi:hypothetical protein